MRTLLVSALIAGAAGLAYSAWRWQEAPDRQRRRAIDEAIGRSASIAERAAAVRHNVRAFQNRLGLGALSVRPDLLSQLRVAPRVQAATRGVNVIRFVIDDLDLNTFNEAVAAGYLPNIKQFLVDPGVVFDNSFVPISLCCPDRATLDSGQYSQNTHVRGNTFPLGGVGNFAEGTALAVALKNAGILSTHVGKYLNGFGSVPTAPVTSPFNPTHVPPGWTTPQMLVDNSTYTAYDYIFTVNGVEFDDRTLGTTPQNYPWSDIRAWNYQVDMETLRALLWMFAVEPAGLPMFISLDPVAPHFHYTTRDSGIIVDMCPAPVDPSVANQGNSPGNIWGSASEAPFRYAGTVHDAEPQGAGFNESDATIQFKPKWVRERIALQPTDVTCLNLQYDRHIEVMRSVDDMVGLMVNFVTQLGLASNTVFIFTSDNGYMRGEHRLTEKLAPYEESIRVPLVIAGPMFAPHHVSQMVDSADIAPTILDLMGATSLVNVDGRSLVPLLQGQTPAAWRNAILVCAFDPSMDGMILGLGAYPIPHAPFCGIRMMNPPRLYTHYAPTATEPIDTELYDLGADAAELNNLNTDPAHAAEVQQFEVLIKSLAFCSGQICRDLENAAAIH